MRVEARGSELQRVLVAGPAPPDAAAPHPPPRHAVQSLYNSPRLPRPRTVNYIANIYSQIYNPSRALLYSRQQSGVGSCLNCHQLPALLASSRTVVYLFLSRHFTGCTIVTLYAFRSYFYTSVSPRPAHQSQEFPRSYPITPSISPRRTDLISFKYYFY